MTKDKMAEITTILADALRTYHKKTAHIKWEENDGRQKVEIKDITYIPRKRKFHLYLTIDNNSDYAELTVYHNARPDFYINTDSEVDTEDLKEILKCVDNEINWVKLNPQKRR